MDFTKIIVYPASTQLLLSSDQLERVFKKFANPRCTYRCQRGEPSFHQYAENFAIIEFCSKDSALRALTAVQNGEIELRGEILQGAPLYNVSPIELLSDNDLAKIFSMLDIGDIPKITKVCKRWKSIADQCSYTGTKLCLFDFADFEEARDCIMRHGSGLKEVVCSVHCPVSFLGAYCPNLENLIIDYEEITGFCDKQENLNLRSAWSQFKNLSRVKLMEMPNDFNCDFLTYLPETVIELQFCCSFVPRDYCYETPIDLSHLPNLQSLTLVGFYLDTKGLLSGFGKLKNLRYLVIEKCRLCKAHRLCLASFNKLEYLVLRYLPECEDWASLFSSIKSLKYFELSYTNILSMERRSPSAFANLKYLRLIEAGWELLCAVGKYPLPFLEHLECQHSPLIMDDALCGIVENAPLLRFVYAAGCRITVDIVKRLEAITMQRLGGILNFFVGRNRLLEWDYPTHDSPYLLLAEVPEPGEVGWEASRGWFTQDVETVRRTAPTAPLLDDYSPIKALPTECLHIVFSYLSMDDTLAVGEVCQRWRSITNRIWTKLQKFDIRDLRYPEDADKCIARCGDNLDEIYYYKGNGLAPLGEYCRSVTKLVVDFQNRIFTFRARRGILDLPDLHPTLLQLKNLTHLMIKDIDQNHDYGFLKNLPETMVEIHIFSEYESTQRDMNVSKFSHLRALTLCGFNYMYFDRVLIKGIERLKNLTYLCLDALNVDGYVQNPLRNFRQLKYLSLQRTLLFRENDLIGIVRNNKDLKYLNLSRVPGLTDGILRAVSDLPNLQTLCLDGYQNSDQFVQLRGIASLENFHYEFSTIIEANALMTMISTSPNLQVVDIMSNEYKIERIIDAAERAACNRASGVVKICLGDRIELADVACSSYVLPCAQLDKEDLAKFEINHYNEWYVKF